MLFLIFTSFTVGSFCEGKDAPNTRVYGKIIGIVGTGRKVKYQIKFINGNVEELARDRIWPRTFDPLCSYFDFVEPNDDGNESVGSLGSNASKKSSKRTKKAVGASTPPAKKRYYIQDIFYG